jgi:hypothetical protein
MVRCLTKNGEVLLFRPAATRRVAAAGEPLAQGENAQARSEGREEQDKAPEGNVSQ